MKFLKSVKFKPPSYSEIFFDTPFGVGAPGCWSMTTPILSTPPKLVK